MINLTRDSARGANWEDTLSHCCDQLTRTAQIVLDCLAFRTPQLNVDFAGGVTEALHVAARYAVGLSGGMMANAVCDVLVRHIGAALSPFEYGKLPMQIIKHRAAGHWIYSAGSIQRCVFGEQQLGVQLFEAALHRFSTEGHVYLNVDDISSVVEAVIVAAQHGSRALRE